MGTNSRSTASSALGTTGAGPHALSGIIVQTPLGWVGAVARQGRILAMSLPMPARDAAASACGRDADFGRPDHLLASLADDLRRYFAGESVDLGRHPVDVSEHPPFRRRALLAARTIGYGEVRSYAWVAERAGRPRGARAAGQAMSRNPIPLVIPCHRVVATGGGLGGFGGGLDMKRALLELEGIACDLRGVRDG